MKSSTDYNNVMRDYGDDISLISLTIILGVFLAQFSLRNLQKEQVFLSNVLIAAFYFALGVTAVDKDSKWTLLALLSVIFIVTFHTTFNVLYLLKIVDLLAIIQSDTSAICKTLIIMTITALSKGFLFVI